MPKKVAAAIKRSVKKAHPGESDKAAESEVYAILNERGYVHGNVETSRGRRAEQKYTEDHSNG